MIKHHQDHNTNYSRIGEELVASKLPLTIRETLRTTGWQEGNMTSVVESYSTRKATIYIQRSKTHPDSYAWVIDFIDGRTENGGSNGESLENKLRDVAGI